jgi:hypothetical protein
MSTVTAAAVWIKINEDVDFLQQPESVRDATRPYVEALPIILADMLNAPVTLNSVMKAKVAFLRYCVDNGFIKAAVDAMPDEALGFFDREDLPEMFESLLTQAIDMAEELTGDVAGLLKENGLTEEKVMLGPSIGLNDEARSLYQAGELIIGELLLIQPMLIVKNTK